jgi:3-deoxy-manno-octulosonate cytidylyltransferase (CMP-KDO synthetase)
MTSKAIGVIPARYKSTRLPGKPLILLEGKPILYHVYKRCSKAKELEEVIIATDDEKIYNEAMNFSANVVMTSPFHRSGTERVAEVCANKNADIIINIQVDEIFIKPEMIDELVKEMKSDETLNMATFCTPITDLDELDDPNVVKLVLDNRGNAIYFSRNAIPYPILDGQVQTMTVKELVSYKNDLIHNYKKHIGIYAYRREFLLQYAQMKPTKLEQIERLEQLRAIEHRVRIKVLETDYPLIGIDTERDLKRVKSLIMSKPELLYID